MPRAKPRHKVPMQSVSVQEPVEVRRDQAVSVRRVVPGHTATVWLILLMPVAAKATWLLPWRGARPFSVVTRLTEPSPVQAGIGSLVVGAVSKPRFMTELQVAVTLASQGQQVRKRQYRRGW